LRFVTVMVFACALAAASHDALKQPATRIPQLFTGAEFSVDFITRQAEKKKSPESLQQLSCADFAHICDAKLFSILSRCALQKVQGMAIRKFRTKVLSGVMSPRLAFILSISLENAGLSSSQSGEGRVAGELEACQRRDRMNAFLQCQNLETSSEHLRMQQGLQRTLGLIIDSSNWNLTPKAFASRV
jgi:hypothetical protein